jgi:hypothetical protein
MIEYSFSFANSCFKGVRGSPLGPHAERERPTVSTKIIFKYENLEEKKLMGKKESSLREVTKSIQYKNNL